MNAYAIPIIVVLSLVGLAALGWRRKALIGTTLVAPCCWAVLAIVAVLGSELAIELWAADPLRWAAALRYTAALTTLLPVMAVLGAKRPQDRAWQFIVLSLWVVLALPAGQWVMFGSGRLELHPAWSWFILILIAVGASNYLPTRFWPSSLLLVGGQIILLAPRPPWFWAQTISCGPVCGLALLVLAIVLAGLNVGPRWRARQPLDRLWLDFRNSWGAVWGLRIAERINASSRMYGWGVQLTWHGLTAANRRPLEDLPKEVELALRESIQTLLRRFVSPQWIEQRLEGKSA